MIPMRDPKSSGEQNVRTLIIIVLLVLLIGLGGYLGLSNDTDRLVEKRAEEICGEGNVEKIEGVEITCKAVRGTDQ